MKALAAPAKSPDKLRNARRVSGVNGGGAISKAQARQFTKGLLEIAARIEGLPADFARNHDYYLHGLPPKMKPVFADTFFFFAILNRADPLHQRAAAFSRNNRQIRVTTDWVITELADGLSRVPDRERFMDLYRHIQLSPAIRVVPASRALLEQAVALYAARPDKDWPLTDCVSFVVMRDEGITQALTGDQHFEQAGFAALLK